MLNRSKTLSLALLVTLAVAAQGGPALAVCTLGVASSGTNNTCIGTGALSQDRGNNSTAVGFNALLRNTSGFLNTAIGASSLSSNTTGIANTAAGTIALQLNTGGSANTAMGQSALVSNTTGSRNVAMGQGALASNTLGGDNTALGTQAASRLTTGSTNTALGIFAGSQWTTGSNNIAIGSAGTAADTATIRLGTPGTQTRTFVAGIRGVSVSGGAAVLVDANGQLGIATSSRRLKEDIQPMGDASSALLELRPVTFRYRDQSAAGPAPLQYGLIAEEVEEVMPGLVLRDAKGQVETVAYQHLPSLLLNEYQKQSRELAGTKARLEAVEAELAALKLAVSHLAAATPQRRGLASAE